MAHGSAGMVRGALDAVVRSSTDSCTGALAATGGAGSPDGVMRVLATFCAAAGVRGVDGSDVCADTGVFWPIIVDAAVEIFGFSEIGPPFATSGCTLSSAMSSWQFW